MAAEGLFCTLGVGAVGDKLGGALRCTCEMKSGFGGSVNAACCEQSTGPVGEGMSKVTARRRC